MAKKKKKSKWFDTSAFDDGYDFGDITKTIKKTAKKTSKTLQDNAEKAAKNKTESRKNYSTSNSSTKKKTRLNTQIGYQSPKKEETEKPKEKKRKTNYSNPSTKKRSDVIPSRMSTQIGFKQDKKADNDFLDFLDKKTTTQPTKRTWFDKGALDDGYEFGDITKTILGSGADLLENASAGIMGMGESAVDAFAWLAPAFNASQTVQYGGNFDINTYRQQQEWSEDFIKKDLYDEKQIAKNIITKPVKKIGIDAENNSVFGEKSDSLVQSAGQLGGTFALQALGIPWWLTTGTTSFGAEAENALNEGASYEAAGGSALISAGAEVFTEKLSGGIKFGGKTADDFLIKRLGEKVSNKTARTLAKLGIDATGEGGEEVLTSVIGNLGSALYKEESLEELLTSEEAMDEYIESFVGGAVLGGGVSGISAIKANKSGRDYVTGLTEGEQKVIDREVEDRVQERIDKEISSRKKAKLDEAIKAEIEKKSEKFNLSAEQIEGIKADVRNSMTFDDIDTNVEITKRERNKIGDQVRQALERGEIDTFKIADTLYRDNALRMRDLKREKQTATPERQAEIDAELNALNDEFNGILEKNGMLQESYRQESLKNEKLDYKLDKNASEKAKKIVQSAIEAGADNTRKQHEQIDFVIKMAENSNLDIAFTSDAELEQLGHYKDVEGLQKQLREAQNEAERDEIRKSIEDIKSQRTGVINGLADKNTRKILLNLDSKKLIEFTSGHEVTHFTEEMGSYDNLKTILKEYAESKGEFQRRLDDAYVKYYGQTKGMTEEQRAEFIEQEVTADLVGEYIFNDQDFISNLSAKEPNIFMKAYDYVKHLYKMATAGSEEARKLEQAKRMFDKAYKEMNKGVVKESKSNSSVEADSNTKYSFSDTKGKELTKEQEEYFKDSVIKDKKGRLKVVYHGTNRTFNIFKSGDVGFHFGTKTAARDRAGRGKNTRLVEAYVNITNPIVFDEDLGSWDADYRLAQELLNRGIISYEEGIKALRTDSGYKRATGDANKKLRELLQNKGYDGIVYKNSFEGTGGNSYIAFSSNQIKEISNVTPTDDPDIRYSISDSNGRELTKGQQEYFKNSKARDDEGRLVPVYHTTSRGGFTVFDPNKSDDKRSFFFTNNFDMSQTYAREAHHPILKKSAKGPSGIDLETLRKLSSDYTLDFGARSEDGYYLYSSIDEFIEGFNQDKNGVLDEVETVTIIKGNEEFAYPIRKDAKTVEEALGNLLENYSEEFDSLDVDDTRNGKGYYEVYLNLEDPLIIDGRGRNWNDINPFADEDGDISWKVNRFAEIAKQYVDSEVDYNTTIESLGDLTGGVDFWLEEQIENGEDPMDLEVEKELRKLAAEIDKAYAEWDGDTHLDEDGEPMSMEDYLYENTPVSMTTRQIAEHAYDNGYDGVIIKDIQDTGKHSASYHHGDVYIAFDSNQIKSVANENPTSDPDIRYSLSDSEGRKLTKRQQEYFKDSKILDEDGNLRVVYHGSSENFTIFDRTKTRANMDIQGNFFSPWDLDAQGYGPNVRAFYLNITNPAPEGVAYKALNKFKGQNGAGIKAREYLESLGYDGVNNEDMEYIAFYPHQIKSIDNDNPTDNPDVRYSYSDDDIAPVGRALTREDAAKRDTLTDADWESLFKTATQQNIDPFMEEKSKPSSNREPIYKEKKVENKKKYGLGSAWDTFQTQFVNRNRQQDKLAKQANRPEIKWKGDRRNNISAEIGGDIFKAQTNNYGEAIGPSLHSHFESILEEGLGAYFNDYLFHLSNIERHAQGVGSQTPAETSMEYVKAYEDRFPEFKKPAEGVHQYGRNGLYNLVENGVYSKEFADGLTEKYKHYVPFFAVEIEAPTIDMSPDEIRSGRPIKRARGGAGTTLQSVEQAMIKQTYAYMNAVATNDLFKEIVNAYGGGGSKTIDTREGDSIKLEDFLYEDETGKYLTAFFNGEAKSVQIPEELFKELKRDLDTQIKDIEEKYGIITKPLQKLSQLRGQLLTTYNPGFIVTNPIKDVQDALLNSKHTMRYIKNIGSATTDSLKGSKVDEYAREFKKLTGQDIRTVTDPSKLSRKGKQLYKYYQEGSMWNRFMTAYGNNATSMEYSDNTDINIEKSAKKAKNKGFLNKLGNANNFMEVMFRYPEFKATLEKGKSFTEALYNAREVTTNFGRGGTISKAINRNGATFFNTSIQGMDKFFRNFSMENGAKGFMSTVAKSVILGMTPAMLNHILLGGGYDDEYEALPEYVKSNYYLFRSGDGGFIRIPKGRMISVLGSAARLNLEASMGKVDPTIAKEIDNEEFLRNAMSQVGVSNPLKENIFAPFIQAYNNEAWYGGDLVPTRLSKLPAAEQYDATTDEFSKWLGEKINVSPYKINYVLDQYTGGIGDIFLPMITPEATSEAETFGDFLIAPIKDKFTVNSIDDNRYVGEIYDLSSDLEVKKNSNNATLDDVLQYEYIRGVTSEINELYALKRQIQSDETLSKAEKYRESQRIQELINDLAMEGVRNYNSGASLELAYESNPDAVVSIAFADYKTYKSHQSEIWNLKADKDENGNTIKGSKQEKVIDYLNESDLDYGERLILFKQQYPNNDTYNEEIIDYLNSRDDLYYEDVVAILETLGFTVREDGTVEW